MNQFKILVIALILSVLALLVILFTPYTVSYDGEAYTDDLKVKTIEDFYSSKNMPLAGYGAKMVEVAKKNNLDWRLLPAISIRESSGGKQMCKNNPFGWASCKRGFDSIDESIEYVAFHLGGNATTTKSYYSGNTYSKLYSYNGTVIKTYPDEVIKIMDKIGKENL